MKKLSIAPGPVKSKSPDVPADRMTALRNTLGVVGVAAMAACSSGEPQPVEDTAITSLVDSSPAATDTEQPVSEDTAGEETTTHVDPNCLKDLSQANIYYGIKAPDDNWSQFTSLDVCTVAQVDDGGQGGCHVEASIAVSGVFKEGLGQVAASYVIPQVLGPDGESLAYLPQQEGRLALTLFETSPGTYEATGFLIPFDGGSAEGRSLAEELADAGTVVKVAFTYEACGEIWQANSSPVTLNYNGEL